MTNQNEIGSFGRFSLRIFKAYSVRIWLALESSFVLSSTQAGWLEKLRSDNASLPNARRHFKPSNIILDFLHDDQLTQEWVFQKIWKLKCQPEPPNWQCHFWPTLLDSAVQNSPVFKELAQFLVGEASKRFWPSLICYKLKINSNSKHCGVGEDSWESLGMQQDQTSQS